MNPPWTSTVETACRAVFPEVVAWRRRLHAHPELAYEERETAEFVATTLTGLGPYALFRPTPTSVVARLATGRPGAVVALRADLDGLPVTEAVDIPFQSRRPGTMHACGHDGHAAMLLGIARLLADWRSQLAGEVRLIFQHAEETPPGGARELVAAGVLTGADAILGAHLWVPLPVGSIGLAAGPVMAATVTFRLTVHGRGGHAAEPHQTVDPIAVGAQIVNHLQHLVGRALNPLEPVVVSVTRFWAGTTTNVIPEAAVMEGTIRAFDAKVQANVIHRVDQIADGICRAHGARYDLSVNPGYAAVVNHPALTSRLRSALGAITPHLALVDGVRTMAAEDFSAYQAHIPGCYLFIGAGNPEVDAVYPHHHPCFTIDEQALLYGLQALAASTLYLLHEGRRL